VPQNSILISIGDNANSALYYLHYIEGIRSDLEIYDPVKTYGMIKDRLGIKRSDKSKLGDELCLKLLHDNGDRAYLVKEHMLVGRTPIDYGALKLTPSGMVYRFGIWPLRGDIWNTLEIPRLSEISNKLDFKGMTMLANLYLCRGEDRLAAGDTIGARNDFEEATKAGALSGEAIVHNSLGIFFRHIRQTDLSEAEYDLALKSWHLTAFGRADIYVNLGNLEKDKGNYDRAIDFYNRALEINQGNKEAGYNLSLTNAYRNLGAGQFREAASDFEKALNYSNADPRIIYNLGVIYDQKLGDRARAIYNYRRFADLAPNTQEGQLAQRRVIELSGQK
jgi:Tfp pilus assembly protein PilF